MNLYKTGIRFFRARRTVIIRKFYHSQIMSRDVMASFQDPPVDVHCWSSSGVETCVTVKYRTSRLCMSFDMGYASKQSVNSDHVFITHGHMDHISGIVQHASKRMLRRLPPATYYVPSHLIEHVRQVIESCSKMSEKPDLPQQVQLKPVNIGDSIELAGGGHRVDVFRTEHSISSQGYLLYSRRDKLKAEYEGVDQAHIQYLVKQGVAITERSEHADIAYTGDTLFKIFTSSPLPHRHLLSVKLLITEATYIECERGSSVEKARSRGHCHLFEFRDHAQLFSNVSHLLLMHFSDKYRDGAQIQGYVERAALPPTLRDKICLGVNYF